MIKITEQPIDASEFITAVNKKENGGLAVFLGHGARLHWSD